MPAPADPYVDQDRETRKRKVRRVAALKDKRQVYDQHARELARYTQPRLGRYVNSNQGAGRTATQGSQSGKGAQVNNRLLDTTGTWASGVLGNGMSSGLASPTEPWFKLTVSDPGLREWKPVKEWLDVVTGIMLEWFSRTNFYDASKAGFLEQGIFGTECVFQAEHWRYGAVYFPMTFGQYWIASDDGNRIGTLYRQPDMTTEQIVSRFGMDKASAKVRGEYAQGKYDQVHAVWHCVEPNATRTPGKLDQRNKAYIGYYWLDQINDLTDPPFLQVEGYNEKPFWAPRWDIIGDDDYGTSPGQNALPALRELQIGKLRKQQAKDYTVRPSLYGTGIASSVGVRLTPGALTLGGGLGAEGSVKPMWEIRPGAIGELRLDIEDVRAEAKQHFYTDLFMAITNMPGVQPRNVEEIARRHEEQLTQLGPVIDRSNNEKLRPAIQRMYSILDRMGMIPPPPEELSHTEFTVQFTSVLVQAQRLIRLGGMERTAGFAGNLIAVQPQAADKINFDQMIDEYADAAGAPASTIRSDEEVAQLRAARAKQEQTAQLAAMAPAAKDGAQAARLLSETDAGDGRSALQRLMGG